MEQISSLTDILDNIKPDENAHYFTEDESFDLYLTCLHLMELFIDDNPTIITEPDFEEIFDEHITELMNSHFEDDIFYNDDAEEELEDIIEHAKTDFFKDYINPRSFNTSCILDDPDIEFITEQLKILKAKPQPVQRTKEWYEMRHNLITASNAYKAFESQSVQNSLIYEKCQPVKNGEVEDEMDVRMVNTNTSLHWGQKYEPLSVDIYEALYNTKVDDFGCIQHDKYKFLGASPDGINVDISSPRYGRMLEIKNIVNREINGIPKKEYWIQMQLQMEVCDLEECDFLETRFTEYETSAEYWNDVTDKRKGVMMHFHTRSGAPFYKNVPFDIGTDKELLGKWLREHLTLYQGAEYNYVWIKNNYWKLDQYSCVLVLRNREWFQTNIQTLQNIWNIIEHERSEGNFEHRAPKRKVKPVEQIQGQSTAITNIGQKPFGCKLLGGKLLGGKLLGVNKVLEGDNVLMNEIKINDINMNNVKPINNHITDYMRVIKLTDDKI